MPVSVSSQRMLAPREEKMKQTHKTCRTERRRESPDDLINDLIDSLLMRFPFLRKAGWAWFLSLTRSSD